eukprot:CCRYP_003360-RD/>CCRYP_003360-RD protein AED:0.07 eAED:0.07 QI:19/1/1/1/0.85/0.75/8/1878/1775
MYSFLNVDCLPSPQLKHSFSQLPSSIPANAPLVYSTPRDVTTTMSNIAQGQHDDDSDDNANPSGGNGNRSAEHRSSLDQLRIAFSQAQAGRSALKPSSAFGAACPTEHTQPTTHSNCISGDANAVGGQQQRSNLPALPQDPQTKSKELASLALGKNEIAGKGSVNTKRPSYPPVTHRPTAQSAGEPAPAPPLVHQPSSTASLNDFEYHRASYPTVGAGKLVDMQKKKLDKQAAKKSELNKQAVLMQQLTCEQGAQQEQPKRIAKQAKTQERQISRKDAAQKKRQDAYKKKMEDDIRKEIHGKQDEIMRMQGHQQPQPQPHIMMQHQHPQMFINQPYTQMIHPQSLQQCYPGQQYATQCFPSQQYALQPNMMYNVMAYPQQQYPMPQYSQQYPAQPMMNDMMSFVQPQQPQPFTASLAASPPALSSKENKKSQLKKKKKKKKTKKDDKESPNKTRQDEPDLMMPPLPPPRASMTSLKNSFKAKDVKERPNENARDESDPMMPPPLPPSESSPKPMDDKESPNKNRQDESDLMMPPLPPPRVSMTSLKNSPKAKDDKERPNENVRDESDPMMPPLSPPKVSMTSPTFEMECDAFAHEDSNEIPKGNDNGVTLLSREMVASLNPEGYAHSLAHNKNEEESLHAIEASCSLDLNSAVMDSMMGFVKHTPLSTHPSHASTQVDLINKSKTEDSLGPSDTAPKNKSCGFLVSLADDVVDQDITDQRALLKEAANAVLQIDIAKDVTCDEDNCLKTTERMDDKDSTALRESNVDEANSVNVTPDSEATSSIKHPAKHAKDDSVDGFAVSHQNRTDMLPRSNNLYSNAPSNEEYKLCRSTIIRESNNHPSIGYTAHPQSELTPTNSIKSSNGIISDDDEAALKDPHTCISCDIATDQKLLMPPTVTHPNDETILTSTEGDHKNEESPRAESSDPNSNRDNSKEPFETDMESDHVPSHSTEPRLELEESNTPNEYSRLNAKNDLRDHADSRVSAMHSPLAYTSATIDSYPVIDESRSIDVSDNLLSQASRDVETDAEGLRDKLPLQVTRDVDTDSKNVKLSKQIGPLPEISVDSNGMIPSSEHTVVDDDDDLSWGCMFMQLEVFKQRFGDLRVPLPQKNEENTTQSGWYHLYVWVKNQREKFSQGALFPERYQKLLNLGLDLNPKPKHSAATSHANRRTSKRKKKKTKSNADTKKISGVKEFAVALTSKASQQSHHTKLQLDQRNEPPQTPLQQPANATSVPAMNVGNNFMAPNLQQPMQTSFQQGDSPAQFIASQQSLQQMQAPYQQFNNTGQAQYTMHFQPTMNTSQPHLRQIGPQMSVQGPYQQTNNEMTVQLSGTNNRSHHHSHIQQGSEIQALQAPYQQFNNTMAPQFTSSINDMKPQSQTNPQSQNTNPQDKQQTSGEQLNNATSSVTKRKHQLHVTGQRGTVEAKKQQPNLSGRPRLDLTRKQAQKNPPSKGKGLPVIQENVSVTGPNKHDEANSSRRDKTKQNSSTSNKADEIRSGKFSLEEEEYCLAVINDFKLGLLDALPGQNICSYLAKKLGCTYLRISKKFHGIVNLPPFAPISIKGSDEKTEKEVANARKRTKALYKRFRSSQSTTAKRMPSPDESVTLHADSKKRASSNQTEEQPAKKLKHRPLEEQAKEAQAEREKAESLMKIYKNTTESTHAPAASQPMHNLFAPQHQFQMSLNPLSTVLQNNFLQAQLHANASNFRLHQAQNLELMHKALFCQVNAYSGINGVSHQSSTVGPSQGHEALKTTVDSAEKDIAAETLCAIRNTGKGKDE